ncbi:GMC family oxidoreductase [Actinokineospora diospyrosa]|uniref:Choline dehydrogenase n=1 Tax=Actinokineospora diospyrosa TaxID=103728 RepID=A0ABT1IMQ0_9PSEU|nr:GMC family oxidoreductase [Actinokineospora diospyrosa]MCP2273741.1 choline dehydrogenase [Actinokineospora diospyrosa]
MTHDVIVVGAGAAGCVVASRLSQDPTRSVLLLEAGPHYDTESSWPADLLDGLGFPRSHDWGFASAPLTHGGHTFPIPRGKVVGGSTAVNYCVALRSRPTDHRAWAALGLPRWAWDEVLPVYQALEIDHDTEPRTPPGRTPVRRYPREELTDSQERFLTACEKAGFALVDDHNAADSLGAGLTPLNQVGGRRYNSALVYLAEAQERPNLTIRSGADVDTVLIRDGRAVGVRLASGEELAAEQVVLSAGAYGSPAILLRSGVGPAEHLREVGVDLVADVPGVGSNLLEHPSTPAVFATAEETAARRPAPLRTMLSVKTSRDEPDVDIHIHAMATMPTRAPQGHPTGFDLLMTSALVAPHSVGSVRLRSRAAADLPVVDTGIYRDPRDAARVAEGLRVIRKLAEQSPLASLLVGERLPGAAVADADLVDAVHATVGTYNHPVGTCRMGRTGDVDAVLDETCRVTAVEDLLVIDASAIPVSPRSTTTLPVLMLAERAVALNWPNL